MNTQKSTGTYSFTPRAEQSLQKFLSEVNSIELLTADEEVALAIRIKEGDLDALEKLVKANIRFVIFTAKPYQYNGLTLNDLLNEGNLGLIKAAQRFDETKGFKFISYAVRWIKKYILEAIVEHGRIVRLPDNISGKLGRINKELDLLTQELESEPPIDILAPIFVRNEEFRTNRERRRKGLPYKKLVLSENTIQSALSVAKGHYSIDTPIDSGEPGSTHKDMMVSDFNSPSHDIEYYDSLKRDVKNSIDKLLTTRKTEMIILKFGLDGKAPLSTQEIADKYGIEGQNVRFALNEAMNTMRVRNGKVLRAYLG